MKTFSASLTLIPRLLSQFCDVSITFLPKISCLILWLYPAYQKSLLLASSKCHSSQSLMTPNLTQVKDLVHIFRVLTRETYYAHSIIIVAMPTYTPAPQLSLESQMVPHILVPIFLIF